MPYLFGVDIGSSVCKVTAINLRGEVAARGEQVHPTRYPRPGWAEQDALAWYWAACQAIRQCLGQGHVDPSDIVGLSVTGPAHNLALMGDACQVLYPTIHWSDRRSASQSDDLEHRFGERLLQITYQRVNPSWSLPQLLWLRQNEPAVWSRLRRILVTKDYVRYRLTGQYQTDVYDAIGTQLYDVGNQGWSAELCELLGFPVTWLPPVSDAWAAAGTLLPDAARDTGLPPGIPVAVGSGDSVVEAFGVGVVEPGQCLIKLGTAANVSLVTARACPSRHALTYRHVIDHRWFSIAATNSGTSTLRWFRDIFYTLPGAQAAGAFAWLDQLAAEAPPGCEGLLFHPYLSGERSPYWDSDLRGDFVGIGAHHQARHFARAVLEGVAFSIRDCLSVVADLGQPMGDLRLLGGGAQSALWCQILCDVLGQPLVRHPAGGASYGAALLAGVAVGLFANWQAAVAQAALVHASAHGRQARDVFEPHPATPGLYSDYYALYRDITHDLASHHHRLAALAPQTALKGE